MRLALALVVLLFAGSAQALTLTLVVCDGARLVHHADNGLVIFCPPDTTKRWLTMNGCLNPVAKRVGGLLLVTCNFV